jgi:hypothetical protein
MTALSSHPRPLGANNAYVPIKLKQNISAGIARKINTEGYFACGILLLTNLIFYDKNRVTGNCSFKLG